MTDKEKTYHLTKSGLEYINEQTKSIYENPNFKGFLELTNKLIDEILISPKNKEKERAI